MLVVWPAWCVASKIKTKRPQRFSFHPLPQKNKPETKQVHLPPWEQTSGFQEYCGRYLDTSTLSSSQSPNRLLHRFLAVGCCNEFHYGMCTRKTTNPREEIKDKSHFICTQEGIYREDILRYYNEVHILKLLLWREILPKIFKESLTAAICLLLYREKPISPYHCFALVALKMYEMMSKCPGKQMFQH